jgi:hypothetical protein
MAGIEPALPCDMEPKKIMSVYVLLEVTVLYPLCSVLELEPFSVYFKSVGPPSNSR